MLPGAAWGVRLLCDPEPGMLPAGARLAEQRDVTNIQWTNSDSARITTLQLPPIDLRLMAKSFHWMNRPQVLADLERLITPTGGVVIASAGSPGTTPLPAWAPVIAQVRTAYPGPVRRAGTYPDPEDRFTDTLQRSPFSAVELTCLEQRVTRDLDTSSSGSRCPTPTPPPHSSETAWTRLPATCAVPSSTTTPRASTTR
ncbi:hypothetical protein [Streptomyces litmocidini]|uniref:hypothetical protein n=1 Tax=Streptomyces litmocidini TaxID=67318 RepID=UPI0037032159